LLGMTKGADNVVVNWEVVTSSVVVVGALVTPGGRGSRVVVARLKRKAVLVAELHTVLLHMHTVKSVPILQPRAT